MRTLSILFLLLAITTAAYASDIPPTARITLENPARSELIGYTGETLTFSSATSTANCGSITLRLWKLDSGSWTSSMEEFTHTFTLPTGVYEQSHTLQLRVVNSCAGLDDIITKTITIRRDQRTYFVKDHLGSVRATVNEAGDVIGYDDYYPFGLVMPGRSSNSANPNDNYKFTGHERDDEAGLTLDYMNARNYDPIIGRFLQIDPLAHEYAAYSPYGYVRNNPIAFIDPTGMFDLSAIEDEETRNIIRRAIEHAYSDLYARDDDGNAKIDAVYANYGADTDEARGVIDDILSITFTEGSGPKLLIGNVDDGNAETMGDIQGEFDESGNLVDISGTVMIDPKADPLRVLTGPYIGAGVKTTGNTMLSRTILHESFHVADGVLGIRSNLLQSLGRDKFDDFGIKLHGYTNSYFGLKEKLNRQEAFYRKKRRGY